MDWIGQPLGSSVAIARPGVAGRFRIDRNVIRSRTINRCLWRGLGVNAGGQMIYCECIRELSIVDDGLGSGPRGQTGILLEVQVQRRILIATQSESDKKRFRREFPGVGEADTKVILDVWFRKRFIGGSTIRADRDWSASDQLRIVGFARGIANRRRFVAASSLAAGTRDCVHAFAIRVKSPLPQCSSTPPAGVTRCAKFHRGSLIRFTLLEITVPT
jgi:hypothetical protein